jgi:PAN domain
MRSIHNFDISLRSTSLWLVTLASCLIASAGATAEAATVTRVDRPHCQYLLSGEIRSGDAERVQRVLLPSEVMRINKAREDSSEQPLPTVCLDSNGGDYAEAVTLAQHFVRFGIGTVIDKGANCYSACALLFMAGTTFSDDAISVPFDGDLAQFASKGLGAGWARSRRLHINAQLGFHAPFLKLDDASANYSRETVVAAYQAANLAVASFLDLARQHGAGSRDPLVKQGLIALMLRHGPTQMFEIDTVDKAGRWDIELIGYRVAPPASQRIARGRACHNVLLWSSDESAATATGANADAARDYDALVESHWAHGWSPKETPDHTDDFADQKRQVFTYSAGFEAAEICQVASVPARAARQALLTIALVVRSNGTSIGTQFSEKAPDGTTLNQGQEIPPWFLLDPATKISELASAPPVARRQSPSNRPASFDRRPNSAYRWSGQAAVTVESLTACEAKCAAEHGCKAFTYFKSRQLCRLMDTPTDLVQNENAISGAKR